MKSLSRIGRCGLVSFPACKARGNFCFGNQRAEALVVPVSSIGIILHAPESFSLHFGESVEVHFVRFIDHGIVGRVEFIVFVHRYTRIQLLRHAMRPHPLRHSGLVET